MIFWDPHEEPYSVRGPACTGFLSDNPKNPEPFAFELYRRGEIDFFKNMGNDCSSVTNNGTNPVNIGTGNKFQNETDYISNTLSFSRTFNNGVRSLNLGNGWSSNFDRFIRRDTLFPDSTIFLYRENGSVLLFHLFDNNWTPDADNSDRLTELKDVNGTLIGWQYLVSIEDSVETYNPSGQLLSIADRAGRTQSFIYDTDNRLIAVNDDVGRALRLTYDSSNRIATLTDLAGGIYRYSYDTSGNLTGVTYPDNTFRIYHYNEPAYTSDSDLPYALTGITDENGVRFATYRYAQGGETISTEHANGINRYQLTYNSDNSTTVTDPIGTQRTYYFQTVLGVVKSAGQSQPGGSGCGPTASSIIYDDNGNITSETDFNGNKTCYSYDLSRNLEIARIEGLSAEQTCPDNLVSYTPTANTTTTERVILTDWHSIFYLPIRTTEAERETSIEYDNYGNLTRYSLKDLATQATRTWTASYLYHPNMPGVMIQSMMDGPRTDVADITTLDYYAPDATCISEHSGCRGQIKQITNALGHVTQITRYNPHGQPEEIIDPNGLITTLTYDARQRLLSRTIGGETTQYDYDAVGELIKLTHPDGSFIRYSYDPAHRLIQIADNLGNRTDYTLDAIGNRIKEEVFDPVNTLTQTRQREFDALNRLWKAIGAQNQINELGYDPNGNLKQSRNPLARITTQKFDVLDRLIQINDPAGGPSQQTYDVLDRVVSVTDPKAVTTTYTYNGLNDLIRENSADRGTTTYTYDTTGNLVSRTDARGIVEMTTYDALNRPINRTYTTQTGIPGTAAITWHYD
ncbi:DUF6531 domain-containing protein [Nitrosomonas communis]|uniref:DUF6531 domain-containing protein n=1 Tax=Nitrosomonas communis TaxID=44574 RepID=UPI0015A52C5D|nr:DUF6531 domain-containing protein [Nitrosomonas communis]